MGTDIGQEARRVILTRGDGGVELALIDDDGDRIEDGDRLDAFVDEVGDVIHAEGVDASEVDVAPDGALWVGGVDADDMASALRDCGFAVERGDEGGDFGGDPGAAG